MARKKMAAPYNAYKIIRSELGLIIVIGFYEPYYDISSVFISNKTVGVARNLRMSTRLASRHSGGEGRNRTILSSFFSQASTIMAEAITMIQARTSWIFPRVLHS